MPASQQKAEAEAQFILDFMMVHAEGEVDDGNSRSMTTVSRRQPHFG